MCGILGIVQTNSDLSDYDMNYLVNRTAERGSDGWGFCSNGQTLKGPGQDAKTKPNLILARVGWHMANFRAEPTTEAVYNPSYDDQQPYESNSWTIVHNGVIANDKELIQEFDLRPNTKIDSWVIVGVLEVLTRRHPRFTSWQIFQIAIKKLVGSFSIIARHRGDDNHTLHYATNYRPLYWYSDGNNCIVSSVKVGEHYKLVPPYTIGEIHPSMVIVDAGLKSDDNRNRCLVVLSGGLDSTVAAAMAIDRKMDVEFLHFQYGCRASQNELTAVRAIANYYRRPLHVVPMHDLFTRVIGGSRLVDPEAQFAETITGAEQAIEWVPARNTIMASIAIGIAEAHGFGRIMLGINNEESGGGYTDNVLDLYQSFNDSMQWIIGVGKTVKFEWPIGSMMKRHIVAEGLRLRAPLHLTWSCYNTGNVHCGKCGPCFMRKTAFEINGAKDPVFECEEVDPGKLRLKSKAINEGEGLY